MAVKHRRIKGSAPPPLPEPKNTDSIGLRSEHGGRELVKVMGLLMGFGLLALALFGLFIWLGVNLAS